MDSIVKKKLIIEKLLSHLRCKFELSWANDTVHNSVYDNYFGGCCPRAMGQCFVTSWLVKEFLEYNLDVHDIVVCRGHLRDNQKVIIADHCWVEGYISCEKFIIDLTQDQSTSNRIYIRSEQEYKKEDLLYKQYAVYKTLMDIKPETIIRVNILRERMERHLNA